MLMAPSKGKSTNKGKPRLTKSKSGTDAPARRTEATTIKKTSTSVAALGRVLSRGKTRKAAPVASSTESDVSDVSDGQRQSMIAEAAYFLAERRGFVPGDEVADWLAAEREIDSQLARAPRVL
jgi:hypothetical protein